MNRYQFFIILSMIFILLNISISKTNRIKRQNSHVYISLIRVETLDVASYSENGNVKVKAEVPFRLRLIANENLKSNGQIAFTNVDRNQGENCTDLVSYPTYDLFSVKDNTALVEVRFDQKDSGSNDDFKICYKENDQSVWIHQGSSFLTNLKPISNFDMFRHTIIIVQSALIPFFLLISGLLSALALSLLSLTKSELRVLRSQGTSEEKKYSKVVAPLRRRGNLLFCSLLLMNTFVNALIAILFQDLISYWSILAATLLIVFLGEIIPQTICSRFGLFFGNTLAWFTNIIVIITFPFSFPISKLLDWMLNDEVPMVYNRDRFHNLIAVNQRPLEINSPMDKSFKNEKFFENLKALTLSNKTVGDIMLSLEKTFMQEYEGFLNEERVASIIKAGYTRIPVFKNTKSNVVALLHLNDLRDLDPSDLLSVKTVCMFHNRPINFVFEDTKLDVILEEFKKGQSHMAMVQRVNSEGPGDPYYETVGMVTLDDVISEIFKPDLDPPVKTNLPLHDTVMHSEAFLKLSSGEKNVDKVRLSMMKQASYGSDDYNGISNNLLTAITIFLSQLPPFQSNVLAPKILEKLIKQSQVISCKESPEVDDEEEKLEVSKRNVSKGLDHVLVEKGKALGWFVLVLEGGVLIEIGAEGFVFPAKAFDHFGLSVLTGNLTTAPTHTRHTATTLKGDQACADYTPDYTVRPDPHTGVTYLTIHQSDYFSAVRASLLKRLNESSDGANDKELLSEHCNGVLESDFRRNVTVSQQQQLEQQMQQQQEALEQQLQQQQQLQEQLHQQQQLQQEEFQQMQQQQQPLNPNMFINSSYTDTHPSSTTPPPTTTPGNIFTSHDDDDDDITNNGDYDNHGDEFGDGIEDSKEGLIHKSYLCDGDGQSIDNDGS